MYGTVNTIVSLTFNPVSEIMRSRSITRYLSLSFLFFLVDREQQITIKAMSGEIIMLKVKPRDSVKEMKIKISETQGFLPSQQRLIFRCNRLEDHYTLSYYGVNEESTHYSPVHLVVRLRLPQKPPMAISLQTMTAKRSSWKLNQRIPKTV